jgi:hypothetical protein
VVRITDNIFLFSFYVEEDGEGIRENRGKEIKEMKERHKG